MGKVSLHAILGGGYYGKGQWRGLRLGCGQSGEPWKSLLWQVTVWNLKTFSFFPWVSPSLSLPPPSGQEHLQTDWKGPWPPDTWIPQVDWNIWKKRREKNPAQKTAHQKLREFFLCFHPCLLGSSCTLLGTINNSAITLIGCIFVDTGGEALEVRGGGFQLQFNTLPLCHPSTSYFQPPCLVFLDGGKRWADRSISE